MKRETSSSRKSVITSYSIHYTKLYDERLAKYEKNYPYIKNLVEADVQKEKILNSGSNIMATHLAYNLNQQKIDAGKVKLFPPQIDKPHGHNPKMLHQGISYNFV